MKDFFIYNYLQNDFFIKNGLRPIGCGKGNKGDIYLKYKRDIESEDMFYRWKQIKYGEQTNPPREV